MAYRMLVIDLDARCSGGQDHFRRDAEAVRQANRAARVVLATGRATVGTRYALSGWRRPQGNLVTFNGAMTTDLVSGQPWLSTS